MAINYSFQQFKNWLYNIAQNSIQPDSSVGINDILLKDIEHSQPAEYYHFGYRLSEAVLMLGIHPSQIMKSDCVRGGIIDYDPLNGLQITDDRVLFIEIIQRVKEIICKRGDFLVEDFCTWTKG